MDRVEIRSTAAIEGNTLSGVAHAFGALANVGGHYETFAQGAFDAALAKADLRAFYNHDTSLLLGRQSAGTLQVEARSDGLAYSINLPNTTYANDLRELVKRGDITEMSFGFIPGQFEWTKSSDGKRVRRHTQVSEMVEVSPVSLPAFTGTSVQLHARDLAGESVRSQTARARARARRGAAL